METRGEEVEEGGDEEAGNKVGVGQTTWEVSKRMLVRGCRLGCQGCVSSVVYL